MKKAVAIGWLILLIVLIGIAIEFLLFIREVKKDVPDLDTAIKSVQAIETNTTRSEAELAGLLNTTRHIALDEQKSQQAQLVSLQQLAVKSAALVDDADVAVKQFGDAAQSLGTLAPAVNASVVSLAADSHDTLAASQQMIRQATADLGDPAIAQALKDTATAAQNIDGITDDTHKATTMLVAKLDATLHPPPQNWFVRTMKIAFGVTLNGAELVYYLTK